MSSLVFPLRSAFLALPLEGESKKRFGLLQEGLRDFEDILAFQNPASPHLTLQFWRELLEIEYTQVMVQAEKIASKASPFILHVTGPGTFGQRGDTRVLFLDIAFSEELARLKKSCPWPSGKPFTPHVTLARVRHPQKFAVHKKQILKALESATFDLPVDRLRLYAEVEGVKQTPLAEFPFAA